MKCPVCKSYSNIEIDLHSSQFNELLLNCTICGCEWSVNHGLVEIVKDSQKNSFLESSGECVENNDYNRPTA